MRAMFHLVVLVLFLTGAGCAPELSDLTRSHQEAAVQSHTNNLPQEVMLANLKKYARSSGCGQSGLTSGTYTLQHNGLSRIYRIYVPTSYNIDQAAKLVMIFHGWGGNENEFLSDPTVIAEADARGYILVAPRGLGSGAPDFKFNSWSFRGSTTGLDGDGVNLDIPHDTEAICDPTGTPDYNYPSCSGIAQNTCAWTQCEDDDVDFTLALVDTMKANLCVDETNIFATGGSNGGMFTWELGQNPVSAPIFRAIAPIIGLPHRAYQDPPGKVGDFPVLVLTGLKDTTVPPGKWNNPYFTRTSDGDRYFYSSATGITKAWAESQNCDTSSRPALFEDGYDQTTCRTYCSNDPDWPRVLDCRANMGHDFNLTWTWPLVMDFFDHHAIK